MPSLGVSENLKTTGDMNCSYYTDSTQHLDEIYTWLGGFVSSRKEYVNLNEWVLFKKTHYEICSKLDISIKDAAETAYSLELS